MDLGIERLAGRTVLRPDGPIDSITADELHAALLGVIGEGQGEVELDFGKVRYLSSAGLRVLVLAAKALRESGRRLRMTGVQVQVMTVLNVANFTSFIDVQSA